MEIHRRWPLRDTPTPDDMREAIRLVRALDSEFPDEQVQYTPNGRGVPRVRNRDNMRLVVDSSIAS